ncbi:hypothetical protein [Desulfogranum japonicum]|uniref:hypothetical protein n=1 Tax=Desulfogranum japonicum TaxID=231447 RepID=UPI0004091201|nr:hypothetical protein [Desulfogranum japonicum]
MERIPDVWPKCQSLLTDQPDEDTITENLVNLLSKDAVVRRLGYLEYQYYSFKETETGAITDTGRIDFVLVLDNDRSVYVAYECKRLNVVRSSGRLSQATDYVDEGIMRFVTEQYSESLPFACMLGYVMDGDVKFAKTQVYRTIESKKGDLGLKSGPVEVSIISIIERFTTTHARTGKKDIIEVRHGLLPFS